MKTKVFALSGRVANNGLVSHFLFIEPLLWNNNLIYCVPLTAGQFNTSLSPGETVRVTLSSRNTPQLPDLPASNPPQSASCPQCLSPLTYQNHLYWCPIKCQTLPQPPSPFKFSYEDKPAGMSANPMLFRYICIRHNARLWPTKRPSIFNLYYNTPLDIALIGYDLGGWAKIAPIIVHQ